MDELRTGQAHIGERVAEAGRVAARERALAEWDVLPYEVLAAPHDPETCPLCRFHREWGP